MWFEFVVTAYTWKQNFVCVSRPDKVYKFKGIFSGMVSIYKPDLKCDLKDWFYYIVF